ncbi:MAG TPA: bifunctional isocitrate dehydrogenase kinase/phosphatase [Candidatus Acidoferrales bacterium]|nr:bifunctional isocitrate dehydrogenase kinase/phosphatase [Candidatus Acidoferrales bacterium]
MSESAEFRLGEAGAEIIASAYRLHVERFATLTRGARLHFERADWHAVQRDSARRLDVYGESVQEALVRLNALLGTRADDRPTWALLRTAYARRIDQRGDVELAETFFNSITRRIFHTIGVDPGVEFVSSAPAPAPQGPPESLAVTFTRHGTLGAMLEGVFRHFRFEAPWLDAPGDVARIAQALIVNVGEHRVRALVLARSVFFRGKGAYLVGQVRTDGPPLPFVLALRRPEAGVAADAVLLSEDEVSIVFSFARSYFFVEMERPRELIDFLRSIMPRKPLADLYTAIGCNKHGKTELYRSLLHHLETTHERFEIAPGQRGMVMCVFTLPGFDVVFKVIRDRFNWPKTVTHDEVRAKYRLVFRHDRAGRLVDAQEFEHLEFDRSRFSDAVLAELTSSAAESVEVRGERVVIRHLYAERRLRPLDLYLREAPSAAAHDAVIDYGQVLRDLAATNIFPGDMLLKNFGVSRHGRLIFYDYDELCPLTECRFRELPQASDDDEMRSAEPWFYVAERDIFPEEFRSFLGLRDDLMATFLAHHGELLAPEFWRRMQQRLGRGEILDIYPYRAVRRLAPHPPDAASDESATA